MNECCYRENNNNNNNNNNNGAYCYYHPSEFLVGVCPLCLNERLLILEAKQGLKNRPKSSKFLPSRNNFNHNNNKTTRNSSKSNNLYNKSKPSISGLPKIFALGSLLSRRDLRHRQYHRNSDHFDFLDFADHLDSTSTSLEDESFISIKFGENGVAVASWDNKSSTNNSTLSNSKVSLDNNINNCTISCPGQTSVKPNSQCVVGSTKPRASLRWRNRIGQMLQVITRKRSNVATTSAMRVKE